MFVPPLIYIPTPWEKKQWAMRKEALETLHEAMNKAKEDGDMHLAAKCAADIAIATRKF